MPVQDKPTLKTYFEPGDKPTSIQMGDLIDSFRHVNDPITVSDLTGFDGIVNPSTHALPSGGTVSLPADSLIIAMVVICTSAGNVKVEIVGDTVFIDEAMTLNQNETIEDKVYAATAKTLTVTGAATIKLLLAKFTV